MNIFKNYYLSIKEKFDLETNTLLSESIFLIIIAIICLFFNRQPDELTILYIFPISIIFIALKELIYADNYKELDNKKWIPIIVFGLLYLIFVFYLVMNPLQDGTTFLIVLSSFMIFVSLSKLFITNKKTSLLYLNILITTILNILIIVFANFVLENLYLYLIILYLLYGIFKLITYFILNKLNR